MRTIRRIVVHHSASRWCDAAAIERWHIARPDVGRMGYHYVILNGFRANSLKYDAAADGEIENGCPLERDGAHARGHNDDSIGICLVGSGSFSRWQFVALFWLVVRLMVRFDIREDGLYGHCELDAYKPECPGFPMDMLRAMIGIWRGRTKREQDSDAEGGADTARPTKGAAGQPPR